MSILQTSSDQITSKKKTLGQQLSDTHEEHQKNFQAESGEVVNAFGPKYMDELKSAAQDHLYIGNKFYIQVVSKHLIFAANRGMQLTFFVRHTMPEMNATEDVWSVNPRNGNIELEWSLPHKLEMKNILRNADTLAPKLVNDIKKYLKKTGLDLTKL
jgi:ribonuclease HI